jgi:CRISPR-associated endonuclease/helicase Cas3
LLSHQGKCLKEHLRKVTELIEYYFPLEKEFLELAKTVAKFHDLGKATFYFQRYLKGEKVNTKLKEHSLLSALFLYIYLREKGFNELFSFLSYLAVKRHHSFPKDVFKEEGVLTESTVKFVKEQLEALPEQNLRELHFPLSLKERLLETLPSLKKKFKPYRNFEGFKKRNKISDFSLYILFLSLYSSLLLADRQDAVSVEVPSLPQLAYEKAKSVVDSLPIRKEIDELRQKAKDYVLSKPFDLKKRVYSINLPTGFGKTYAGFLFALKMVKELRKVGKEFKVIYALPFISIIDQTYEVLRGLLEESHGKVDSSFIVKHHHLTEPRYEREGEELPFDWAKLLFEGWESSLIITTMVQLVNALFPKNRGQALRFSRLSRSVIILDEVQTIPLRYWRLLREVLLEFSEKLDFYIIFMTATKPLIFREDDYIELAGKGFFKNLNRYKVEINLKKQTLEELVETFTPREGKSYLFIFNTVASSQKFYNLLVKKGIKEEELDYLSSSITPFERRERIKKAKEKKTRILVSTQVVEAGVDVDFDEVIRDLAPFDSLNQSAGRCNRNQGEQGTFRVVNLINDEGRCFWSFIYDKVLVNATEEILEGKNQLTEEEFVSLVEDYFRVINERGVNEKKEVEPLLEAVRYLRFSGEGGKSIQDIELIREEFYKSEVFIQLNEKAVRIWEEMKRVFKRLKEGEKEAYKEFLRIKPKFYDFVVRANVKGKDLFFDEELGIYYVPMENLENYYGKTGLKEPDLFY